MPFNETPFDHPCPFCATLISAHDENEHCFAAMMYLCTGYWAGQTYPPRLVITDEDRAHGIADALEEAAKVSAKMIWAWFDGPHAMQIVGEQFNTLDKITPVIADFVQGSVDDPDFGWTVDGVNGMIAVTIESHNVYIERDYLVGGLVRAWLLWKIADYMDGGE